MEKTMLRKHRLFLISLTSLMCFIFVDFLRSNLSGLNSSVNLWTASINSNFFRLPAEIISIAFDTTSLLVISVAVAVILFFTLRKSQSILLLASMGGAALLVDVCKILVASSRPLNEVIPATNFSFPSGHVTSIIVFGGILSYLAWENLKTRLSKALIGVVYVSAVAIIGFDRLYLNVHWLSDVVGAIFLGIFWLTLSIYTFSGILNSSKIRDLQNRLRYY